MLAYADPASTLGVTKDSGRWRRPISYSVLLRCRIYNYYQLLWIFMSLSSFKGPETQRHWLDPTWRRPTPDSETWSCCGWARFCNRLMFGVRPSRRFCNESFFSIWFGCVDCAWWRFSVVQVLSCNKIWWHVSCFVPVCPKKNVTGPSRGWREVFLCIPNKMI